MRPFKYLSGHWYLHAVTHEFQLGEYRLIGLCCIVHTGLFFTGIQVVTEQN